MQDSPSDGNEMSAFLCVRKRVPNFCERVDYTETKQNRLEDLPFQQKQGSEDRQECLSHLEKGDARKGYNFGLRAKNAGCVRDMSENKVKEIERAIQILSPEELEELRVWLDEYARPQPPDVHVENDLAAERLGEAVKGALHDEKHGKISPL
jgi:hypothetical protein